MVPVRALIFDLGGTLLDFPDWDAQMPERWRSTFTHARAASAPDLPDQEAFVQAMVAAEHAHWRRVDTEHWSGPPTGLISDGFARLGRHADERTLVAVLDAYARAIEDWARPFPDAQATLQELRGRGYRVGLLSNTWWAADWHNAHLATHGLDRYLDELVYTSDLQHSKPHPAAFQTIAGRLGVAPQYCLMIGDRPIDDVGGALGAGMRAVLKLNGRAPSIPPHIVPTATIDHLAELPALVQALDPG